MSASLLFTLLLMSQEFFTAIRNGDEAAVSRLLDQSPQLLQAKSPEGASPVLYAFYARKPHLAALFAARGAKYDLYEASAAGDLARVRALLAGNERAESFSPDGFTPLGLAVYFDRYEIAELLLESGANAGTASRNRIAVAPLHSSIESGDPRLVRLLLSHGAPVDPVEFLGATPLHAAAMTGKTEIAMILLDAGADRRALTKDKKTPADLARQHGHAGLAALLE
ncbi:MAG TPA: hypothetical protein DEH78_17940 [Solibacterales bacterium]|nr:hypothetical protein [Bryobacterales bacterium]